MELRSRMRELFGCRLCWRVTLAVFALILVVESAILIPSAQRFERTELDRLADQAVIAIEPVLLVGGALRGGSAPSQEMAALVGQYRLAGLALYGGDGSPLLRVGEHEGLSYAQSIAKIAGMMAERVGRSVDGKRTDVAWRSGRAGEPLVLARLDSGHIRGELVSYLLRIGGLVAIIVLVVTAGTMLVLHFTVLRPLLALRKSALAAGTDPDHADRYAVGTKRRDEMGDVIHAHDAMLERVADSKRRDRAISEERARFLSHHDPLTGLPNRAALIEFLERCPGLEDGERHASLFLINLRRFREMNAGAMPQRGDELLRRLAAMLKRTVPVGDFAAHLGADRFAVARVRGADGNDVEYAEQILRAVKQACESGGAEALRVRIGIASAPMHALDALALLGQAEFALSRTQAEDSGEYQFFSAQLAGEASERQALVRDLSRALQAGELYPVYQPKMSLGIAAGPNVAGAEVLLRWRSATRGVVSPAVFIPLAEATGLIVPIGDFVLRAACAQTRAWLDRHGWAPRLAVNLSARQFSLPDLKQRLEDALAEQRLSPSMLEVEITETAAMRDVASTAETLTALRGLGVHVSIDDFGSGYSSLIYLHRFAVDAIKIDRSFVESIGTDHHGEAICDAVLRLGQALGTRVVAEGVETEAQLDFLRRRLRAELVRQFGEAVDRERAGGIRIRIGRAAGAPFLGPAHERGLVAAGACRVQVEVVAGDHHDFGGLQLQPFRGCAIGLGPRLVDTDHFAGNDGVPVDAVFPGHVHHQRGGEQGEGGRNVALAQALDAGDEIRPGIQRMPGPPDGVPICGGECVELEFRDYLVQLGPMHVVEVERGMLGIDDALERAAAVFVGDRRPVGLQAARGPGRGERAADAAMPVEDGAAGVEGERFHGHAGLHELDR